MDPQLIRLIVFGVAGLMIFAGVGGFGVIFAREAHMASQRKARLKGEQAAARPMFGDAVGAVSRVVQSAGQIGNRMATKDPAQLSALRQKLTQSGFHGRDAVAIYLGARMTALMAATGACMLILPWVMLKGGDKGALFLVAALSLAAVMGPDKFVEARRKKRELEYREGFPDVLDLLVASVEAGLSLDAAVSRVTEEMVRRHPNMAVQLRFLTLELRAGRSRKDAWQSFADRLGLDEARAFATMLRQTEEMGTSLGETLTVFSDEMRSKRMLRAEEKAMALPAKLIVPLILFIFPCLLGVLILPAAFRISRQFAGM
ncbi:type II secretion system F family protein [soil metagenome]